MIGPSFLILLVTHFPKGDPSINQDGAAVQLGYFSQATAENSSPVSGFLNMVDHGWSILATQSDGDGFFSFTVHFKEGSQFVQVYDDTNEGEISRNHRTL